MSYLCPKAPISEVDISEFLMNIINYCSEHHCVGNIHTGKTWVFLFLFFLCSQRWRSSIQSTKTRLGADCGSDHECLIAKFRLKLKKVGKTTRPFRYDLNQIPYDYTVEVRNRFKGLDLIDRVPDEL